MTNKNMINPANYYNPFAKYNYVSKTRGAYIPQDAEVKNNLWTDSSVQSEKSSNIFSVNYDPELDITQSIDGSNGGGILNFISEIFSKDKKN